jgi:kynurenine formamidase
MPDAGTGNQAYGQWISELASKPRFGVGDRRGTANFIDDAARKRAIEATVSGTCVSLTRTIEAADDVAGDEIDVLVEKTSMAQLGTHQPFAEQFAIGEDVARVRPHGVTLTHIDALNHMGWAGKWYGGFPVDGDDGPDLADLAEQAVFTRGVVVDIPGLRRVDHVVPGQPVTGAEIDAALERQGSDFLPGDALLLYMGRDRFEDAGHTIDLAGLTTGRPVPGAGPDAARWIVEHEASLIAWDFLDAFGGGADEPVMAVHMLIPAIGLVIVDHCHFGPVIDLVRRVSNYSGALVVGISPVPKATGALVQPLFIQ